MSTYIILIWWKIFAIVDESQKYIKQKKIAQKVKYNGLYL